jgi:hypothetical protein
MKVSATKGADLLVAMQENFLNKNIIAIILAYLYNDTEPLSGEVSFKPLSEKVFS